MEDDPEATAIASRAKRILHIQKVTGLGGSERHLQILLPRLDRRKFDVSLLLLTMPSHPIDEYVGFFRDKRIRAEQLVIRRHVDPRCLIDVSRRIRARAVDLVHTHLIHADLYGELASRLAGVRRIVSTRHNDDSFRRRSTMRILTRLSGWTCARVITPSRYLTDFTRRLEGIGPEKIRTIPYALEYPIGVKGDGIRDEIGLGPDTPLVVAVGRLVEQKGHRYLLQAWPTVIASRPDARLLVVGDGPWRARLAEEARALGVTDTVTFTGWRRDVPAVWLDADYGIVRIVTRERLPNGARLLDLTFSEHRPLVGGLYFPYRQEVFVDGRLLVLFTVRSVAINTNPADALFDPASLRSP